MRAGVAVGDISPGPGVLLGGYPPPVRPTSGVHDRLHCAAAFLDDEQGGQVLLVTLDASWLTRRQADAIRSEIGVRTGLAIDAIVVTASHTHSAPLLTSECFGLPMGPTENDYTEFMIRTAARLGAEAVETTFPAEVGFGSSRCGAESGIGGNRLDPVNGPTDTEVPVLAVRDRNGTMRALITRYGLHPTILQGENTEASADFPGAMRHAVNELFPDAAFLYSMGLAGDQSSRYFRSEQSFAEVERFGRTLGAAVAEAVAQLRWLPDDAIRLASGEVTLVLKKYPAPEVAAARLRQVREREASLIAAGAPYTGLQTAHLWVLGAQCDYENALAQADGTTLRRYAAGQPYVVTVLAIGELCWVFWPGEVFADFGLDLKRRSPFPVTTIVTLANGGLPGYCVTPQAQATGGYEAGNSILDPRTGDVLVETTLQLLATLEKR